MRGASACPWPWRCGSLAYATWLIAKSRREERLHWTVRLPDSGTHASIFLSCYTHHRTSLLFFICHLPTMKRSGHHLPPTIPSLPLSLSPSLALSLSHSLSPPSPPPPPLSQGHLLRLVTSDKGPLPHTLPALASQLRNIKVGCNWDSPEDGSGDSRWDRDPCEKM